jgi:hypothetical protein
MFLTDVACQAPQRTVANDSIQSCRATARNVFAPALCASLMTGRTFAAWRSASAFTVAAPLRVSWSLGLPRVTPRALAADPFCAHRKCRLRFSRYRIAQSGWDRGPRPAAILERDTHTARLLSEAVHRRRGIAASSAFIARTVTTAGPR